MPSIHGNCQVNVNNPYMYKPFSEMKTYVDSRLAQKIANYPKGGIPLDKNVFSFGLDISACIEDNC